MGTAIVSSKGWVVIPAELRKKYRLRAGTRVRVVDYGGVLSLHPELADPVKQSRGMLKGGPSLTAALLRERTKERKREDR
jgi:AbrB family looped-hinge helix DNA binding protein